MKYYNRLIFSACFFSLMGCSATQQAPVELNFEVPQGFVGDNFSNRSVPAGWLATFNDPKLNSLAQEVLEKNFDIKIASAKVDSAIAAAKQAGADLLPSVNAGFQAGQSDSLGSGSSRSSLGASLDVSWEVDVWGRIRAGKSAAVEELAASQLDYDYARLSLIAQTVKAYFLAIESNRQLQLSRNSVASYRRTTKIVKAFFEEGIVGIQDVHLALSGQARAEDALQIAISAELDAIRSLEALLGRYPSAKLEVAGRLPELPAPMPSGIPSQVLERRPDIVAAERRVAAAFDKIKQAKAAKLPRISLTGSIGGSGTSLANAAKSENIIWNVVTNIMFPIFDAGRLQAQLDAANSVQKQALAAYQKTALQAFKDIETALSNENIFRKRVKNLRDAHQQAKRAEEISLEKYQSGEGNLLDVQQLRRSSFSAKSALLKIEHSLLVQRVNLYLGLGGSF